MTDQQLYPKLAIERCQMYVAQLHAAYHFEDSDVCGLQDRDQVLNRLLRGLSEDLKTIERFCSERSV